MFCVRTGFLGFQRTTGISTLKTIQMFRQRKLSGMESTKTVLIVGLGNHGLEWTRHSVGMRFVERLADLLDVRWSKDKKLRGLTASQTFTTQEWTVRLILLKPRDYMNVNGSSVGRAARFYQPEQIYLIHDELDKPVGKFTLKEGGSSRGHNGVKSVHSVLGTNEVPRLRLGIDRPSLQSEVSNYVLQAFTKSEEREIEETVRTATWTLLKHIETHVLEQTGLVQQLEKQQT